MSNTVDIIVPDIGDFDSVPVIEVLVKVGDSVKAEDGLITLESDKATMDIPSPANGVIKSLSVNVGDDIAQGTVIGVMDISAEDESDASPEANKQQTNNESEKAPAPITTPAPKNTEPALSSQNTPHQSLPPIMPAPAVSAGLAPAHASPSIRRFARELGADLQQIRGSGAKGRILRDDVTAWVKYQISNVSNLPAAGQTGMGIPPIPEIDFSEFGEIEMEAFSRIKKVSGPHLHR
ncbi:MAG: biotin/lipoyl-containing protein, partial [Arenicellales bacterium]